jgi:hypothetical protein
MSTTREEDLRKLVNSSGFLFQLRVENEIQKNLPFVRMEGHQP